MKNNILEGKLVIVKPLSRKGTFMVEIKDVEGIPYPLYRRCGEADGERERLFKTASDAKNQRVSIRYREAELPWGDNLIEYLFRALTFRFKPYRDIPQNYQEIREINIIPESPCLETGQFRFKI